MNPTLYASHHPAINPRLLQPVLLLVPLLLLRVSGLADLRDFSGSLLLQGRLREVEHEHSAAMSGMAAQLERARKERTALALGIAAVASQAVRWSEELLLPSSRHGCCQPAGCTGAAVCTTLIRTRCLSSSTLGLLCVYAACSCPVTCVAAGR